VPEPPGSCDDGSESDESHGRHGREHGGVVRPDISECQRRVGPDDQDAVVLHPDRQVGVRADMVPSFRPCLHAR